MPPVSRELGARTSARQSHFHGGIPSTSTSSRPPIHQQNSSTQSTRHGQRPGKQTTSLACVVRATPSSVLFRDWRQSGSARSRTLLLKVERGSVPIKLTISQCFTPCFHAEIVTGSKEDADAAPVEDAEAASGGPQVLLSRDDVQRGEVIQLKISLNPPEELLEVEQNFKDCLVILANENLVMEVPIYALGKVKDRAGFDIVDNLSKIRHWPKIQVLQNLIHSFVDQHHVIPSTASTSSLPASRQTAMGGSHSHTFQASLGGFHSVDPAAFGNSLGMGSMSALGTFQELDPARAKPIPDLTRNDIAFEIDGVFYNTLGAEIGRLGEHLNIFHLNEVEIEGEYNYGDGEHQIAEEEQELDMEESQVIADQQLIASQLVSYLNEIGDGLGEGLADLSLAGMPSASHASSASTSYANSRINTPQVPAPIMPQYSQLSSKDRMTTSASSSQSQSQRQGAVLRQPQMKVVPPPPPALVREMQKPYEESPRSSRLSRREMEANWDAIEGI